MIGKGLLACDVLVADQLVSLDKLWKKCCICIDSLGLVSGTIKFTWAWVPRLQSRIMQAFEVQLVFQCAVFA